jgi:hypothetical protein
LAHANSIKIVHYACPTGIKVFTRIVPSGEAVRDTISEQIDALNCQIANAYRIRFYDLLSESSREARP